MYTVKFTDKSKSPISIDEEQIDNSTAITLFGRKRLSYGKNLQENLLHILENFACPEDADNPGTPDKIKAISGVFDNPVEGQCWYNSTVKTLTFYDGVNWVPFAREDDIAANWGVIVDGQYLPKPVSEITGKVFDYPECAWIVSPFSFPQKLDYMECSADDNALVTMKYRLSGSDELIGGTANYLIIGISGNQNAPQPTFMITPTPTPTPTSSLGASPTPTPTLTPTVTPTISVTPSVTPEPTLSPTPSVSPSVSYQVPVSRTPTPSPTRTPVASVTPTPSPTPSITPSIPSCESMGMTGCVVRESYLPDGKFAGDIQVGDSMILADETTLEPGTGVVSYSEPSLQPCVRIETKNGASLVCSTSAPIPTTEGLINAPYLMGKFVATSIDSISMWDEVISVNDVGDKWVQDISVSNKCFWAGETNAAFILHHNQKHCASGCVWDGGYCCDCGI